MAAFLINNACLIVCILLCLPATMECQNVSAVTTQNDSQTQQNQDYFMDDVWHLMMLTDSIQRKELDKTTIAFIRHIYLKWRRAAKRIPGFYVYTNRTRKKKIKKKRNPQLMSENTSDF